MENEHVDDGSWCCVGCADGQNKNERYHHGSERSTNSSGAVPTTKPFKKYIFADVRFMLVDKINDLQELVWCP